MAGSGNGSNAQSRLDFDHELVFRTLTGDSLTASVKRLDLTEAEERVTCTLSFEVQQDVYRQLIAEEWMGLHAVARSIEADMVFEEDQPIQLRAVLRHSLIKAALHNGTEAEQVLQTLLQDSEAGRALRQSESWLITEVKQQVKLPEEYGAGSLKKGYRTLWAQPAAGQAASVKPQLAMNEIVEGYLSGKEIPYERLSDTLLRLSFTGENGSWIVLVRTDEEKHLCVVYSVYPELVPEEHRNGMAVFLIEENYDLAVGSFELDPADGELRYRTSIDVENDRLTRELFGQLFKTNVVMMDHYFHVLHDGSAQGFAE